MRLWHTDLIDVLPKQQLLGQWRELNSIYRRLNRHVLINFIYESPNTLSDLYSYSIAVMKEMDKRGYKINTNNFNVFFNSNADKPRLIKNFYPNKMTYRYLRQCLYNLHEKYDCGAISNEEWDRIVYKFADDIEY